MEIKLSMIGHKTPPMESSTQSDVIPPQVEEIAHEVLHSPEPEDLEKPIVEEGHSNPQKEMDIDMTPFLKRPWWKDWNLLKINIMLFMIICYFFAELAVGIAANSLTLIADSFHMISDGIGLLIGGAGIIVHLLCLML